MAGTKVGEHERDATSETRKRITEGRTNDWRFRSRSSYSIRRAITGISVARLGDRYRRLTLQRGDFTPMAGTQRIEHVVVLMLENRSFDHIFGYRTGLNGLGGDEYSLLDPTKAVSNSNPAFYVSNGAPFAVPVGKGRGIRSLVLRSHLEDEKVWRRIPGRSLAGQVPLAPLRREGAGARGIAARLRPALGGRGGCETSSSGRCLGRDQGPRRLTTDISVR
jgi:hypothetical protein